MLKWALMQALHVNTLRVCVQCLQAYAHVCVIADSSGIDLQPLRLEPKGQTIVCQSTEKGIMGALILDHKSHSGKGRG